MLKKVSLVKKARQGRNAIHKDMAAAKQEICENLKGLFDTLREKFKPHHDKAILSSQYYKLIRNSDG